MALIVTRMKPQKSYEHVVEQIESAICDGALKAGERLPSEMKLKEMFDTSRGTVREALRVLEQKGLVGIKTGVKGGARVKEANTEAMSDSMGLLIRHKKVSLTHLAQFRTLLEGHAAEQAARAASKADIQGLKDILADIHTLVAADPDSWDEFNGLDARFHKALARIGKNPLILANLDTIHENIHSYFHLYLPFSRDLLDDDVRDLENILAAVEKKDAKRAGELARDHVDKFSRLMETHEPG